MQTVPSAGAYDPASHMISVVVFGHTEPGVHGRHEMGVVVALY